MTESSRDLLRTLNAKVGSALIEISVVTPEHQWHGGVIVEPHEIDNHVSCGGTVTELLRMRAAELLPYIDVEPSEVTDAEH